MLFYPFCVPENRITTLDSQNKKSSALLVAWNRDGKTWFENRVAFGDW